MAAAGLGGYVLCGLNTTRRGEALAADVRRAHCQFVVTDAEHRPLLDGLDLEGTQILDTSTPQWAEFVEDAGELVPHRQVAAMDAFMMIFTSGTSGNPKAVQVSHLMATFAGINLVAAVRPLRAGHLLRVDAAVPLQRGRRGVGARGGLRRRDRAGEVLGEQLPRRRPPLRCDVHELRRQAACLHPGHAGTRRRRRQSAAGGVR